MGPRGAPSTGLRDSSELDTPPAWRRVRGPATPAPIVRVRYQPSSAAALSLSDEPAAIDDTEPAPQAEIPAEIPAEFPAEPPAELIDEVPPLDAEAVELAPSDATPFDGIPFDDVPFDDMPTGPTADCSIERFPSSLGAYPVACSDGTPVTAPRHRRCFRRGSRWLLRLEGTGGLLAFDPTRLGPDTGAPSQFTWNAADDAPLALGGRASVELNAGGGLHVELGGEYFGAWDTSDRQTGVIGFRTSAHRPGPGDAAQYSDASPRGRGLRWARDGVEPDLPARRSLPRSGLGRRRAGAAS